MEKFLDYFVPERYTVKLAFHKAEKTFSGLVVVDGEAKSDVVKFHVADNLRVASVLIGEEEQDFKVADGALMISGVSIGTVSIAIAFDGKLNENMLGVYLSTCNICHSERVEESLEVLRPASLATACACGEQNDNSDEAIIATQFESHYARACFPCVDEPAAKAVFSLSIAVDDVDDLILSNTALVYEKTTEKTKFARFENTPRMSTYLVAFVIGKFNKVSDKTKDGVLIETYGTKNHPREALKFANEVAKKSIEFYEDAFRVKYPLPRLLQVALPDFDAGAMENWGLVTYRESMMLADKNATLDTKKCVALTVAHELSHQWFGNLVTMEWWDDLWLNESFASVMEYYAVDALYPEFNIWEGFFTSDCLAALRRDACSDVQSVHQEVHSPEEIATLFDGAIVYSKGARLILMLIRLMGWDKFRDGIHEYFEKYAYKNTVGDNLWECLDKYADFNVGEMMHAFIDKPGYPVVDVSNNFAQQRFLLDGEFTDDKWPLPEVREDMSGHYVLNLTNDEFEKRLAKFGDLGLEEKLRLLIDRDLLARAGAVSPATLIPLVGKFKNENSAAVWRIILTIIGNLKIYFEFKSKEEKSFKKFVGELVVAKLAEVGLTPKSSDDSNTLNLREILLALDFYAETENNLRALADLYDDDMAKINAEIRSDVLDAKIYLEPEMMPKFLQKYQEVADPEIKADLLFAMTLTRDEKILPKVVDLLKEIKIVKPQDQLHLFIYLYRNPRAKEKVFDFMTKNWDFIKKMSGDKSLDGYPRYLANMIKSKAEFEKYLKFFEPMGNDLALARAIKIGKKEIAARLEQIEKYKNEVASAASRKISNS